MKIFEVIAGFGAGGAETFLKDLAIGFKKKDHEVIVIIIDQFSDDVSEVSKINQLRDNGIEVISLNRKCKERNFFIFFKIFKLLMKHKPEVVHIHSFLAAIYFFPFSLYGSKAKFFQTIHSTHIIETKLQKIFYSKLLPLRYKNIYCSEVAGHSLKNILGEGMIINNGIYPLLNKNIRKLIEEEYNIPSNSFIALNVGRITKAKNQELLLNLVEKLNIEVFKGSFYLLVCGKHFNDSLYQDLICNSNQLKFKDNIKFIGVKDNISDLMYSSDLYISSSIYEGLPITVLEAMNTGVPLVLSPIQEHLNVFKTLDTCYFPETNTVNSYFELFKEKIKKIKVDKKEIRIKRELLIEKYHINTTILNYLKHFNVL